MIFNQISKPRELLSFETQLQTIEHISKGAYKQRWIYQIYHLFDYVWIVKPSLDVKMRSNLLN